MVVKVVTWTLFIYFAYCGLLFLIQRQMLFPRYLVEMPSKDEDIPFVEKIWIETGAGKIEAWFLPPLHYRLESLCLGKNKPLLKFFDSS